MVLRLQRTIELNRLLDLVKLTSAAISEGLFGCL